MIAFVKGTVAGVTLTSAVLEVGGVGLELNCTPNTLATLRVGAATTLPTSMVVREESLTLFGFLDDDEIGFPFLERVRASNAPVVAVHKGLGGPLPSASVAAASPRDVGPAAAAFPDLDLVVNITYVDDDSEDCLKWEWTDDVDWEPKVKMTMSSETANKYFQGKENVPMAIARRRIKTGGDVKAALALIPITKASV